MSQPYRFPRSQGSIDLTDPNLPPPTSLSAPQLYQPMPRPSFVITNATPQDGIPRSVTEQQHLARMTSATQTLLSHPNSSSQHLSITGGPQNGGGKTLSRISEYSESAYSGEGSSRPNSHEPEVRSQPGGLTPSASASTSDSAHGTTPTTMSFSFPAPPAHSSPPAPTIPLPDPPHSHPRSTLVNHSPFAYPALPGSPSRSHLPSRPITALTTPLPSSNPHPVPVPISNFANPNTFDRSTSPQYTRSGSQDSPRMGDEREVMVQLPGRAITNPRASYHHSQPSDSTAWTMEGKYSTDKDPFAAYDAVSIAPSGDESNHRFTLDNNEKSPSRLGSIVPVKKGANRKLLWFLAVLAVIGIALGAGLGVGLKNLKPQSDSSDGVVGVSDSDPPSKSVLLPGSASSSSPSFVSPSRSAESPSQTVNGEEAFSTTFGYRIGSETTVVPLSYTIPTSYFTREDGRIQFTQQVVLPSLSGEGSFTSDLRFRVPPTDSAASSAPTSTAATRKKRDMPVERQGEKKAALDRHQERRSRSRDIR